MFVRLSAVGQDYIIKHPNDTIKCTIKKVKRGKVGNVESLSYVKEKSNVLIDIDYDKIKKFKCQDSIITNVGYLEFPKNKETGKVCFSNVVETGKSKNDMYVLGKEWFVNNFKSSNDVIQMDSKEDGIIMGKGFSRIPWVFMLSTGYYDLYYTIKLSFKENKYKYEITDFIVKYPGATVSGVYYPPSETPLELTKFSDENFLNDKKPRKTDLDTRAIIHEKMSGFEISIKNALAKEKPKEDW